LEEKRICILLFKKEKTGEKYAFSFSKRGGEKRERKKEKK